MRYVCFLLDRTSSKVLLCRTGNKKNPAYTAFYGNCEPDAAQAQYAYRAALHTMDGLSSIRHDNVIRLLDCRPDPDNDRNLYAINVLHDPIKINTDSLLWVSIQDAVQSKLQDHSLKQFLLSLLMDTEKNTGPTFIFRPDEDMQYEQADSITAKCWTEPDAADKNYIDNALRACIRDEISACLNGMVNHSPRMIRVPPCAAVITAASPSGLTAEQQQKLNAITQFVQTDNRKVIARLAERLDDFTYLPYIYDLPHYGRYLIVHTGLGDNQLARLIENNPDKFKNIYRDIGASVARLEHGRFVTDGYVGYTGETPLTDLLKQDEEV